MFRPGQQAFGENKQDKQKQKKKLSFKDPESEKRDIGENKLRNSLGESKSFHKVRKSNIQEQVLEDEALQIVQSVGQAFSQHNIEQTEPCLQQISPNVPIKKSELIPTGCLPSEVACNQKSSQQHSYKIIPEDQNYFDALRPYVQNLHSTMKCPTKLDGVQSSAMMTEHQSRTIHHQIQLLKYQLDQQSQQTEAALYQVQLLKDQMKAESAARYKVEIQNQQLMAQNKELLIHIERLFHQIEDLEMHIDSIEKGKNLKISRLQSPKVTAILSTTTERNKLDAKQIKQVQIKSENETTTNKKGSITSTKYSMPISKSFTADTHTEALPRHLLSPATRNKDKDIMIKSDEKLSCIGNDKTDTFVTGCLTSKQDMPNQDMTPKFYSIRGEKPNNFSLTAYTKETEITDTRTTTIHNAFSNASASHKRDSGSELNNMNILELPKPLFIVEPSDDNETRNSGKILARCHTSSQMAKQSIK